MDQRFRTLFGLTLGLAVLLLASGKAWPPGPPIDSPINFGAILSRPSVIQLCRNAERDLFWDRWDTQPKIGHYNVSRSHRVADVTRAILDQIEPLIARMSTQALWDTIVTDKAERDLPNGEVASSVYTYCNYLIMSLLKTKPRAEVELLQPTNGDKSSIDTGPSGPPMNKQWLKQSLLEHPDRIWTPGFP